MAEYEGDELPSVDHGPLNEGPWEKQAGSEMCQAHIKLWFGLSD